MTLETVGTDTCDRRAIVVKVTPVLGLSTIDIAPLTVVAWNG
ncbi:hypothetical protein [Phytoactinopolyspora endophytica]|nr:hypothetical protein [Phytoactinopolyspora endophytica]